MGSADGMGRDAVGMGVGASVRVKQSLMVLTLTSDAIL